MHHTISSMCFHESDVCVMHLMLALSCPFIGGLRLTQTRSKQQQHPNTKEEEDSHHINISKGSEGSYDLHHIHQTLAAASCPFVVEEEEEVVEEDEVEVAVVEEVDVDG